MFALDDVLAGTGGRLLAGRSTATFYGVSIDSRTVGPGDLFVAFKGTRTDGHAFVEDALQRGASGVLLEDLPGRTVPGRLDVDLAPIVLCANTGSALADLARYWRRKHPVQVIAVTGSVGKTSTKEVVSSLLEQRFAVLRTTANLNTEIGLPMCLMQLEPRHTFAVLELGMQALGEIQALAQICEPDVGIVTNVHPVHLERLGSMERIAQAKRELIAELPSTGLAVLNADDPRVRTMARAARCPSITFGTEAEADVRATELQSQGLDGIRFQVTHAQEVHPVQMRTIGIHSVYAALAAVAVALRAGVRLGEAATGLGNIPTGPRLIALPGINESTVLDDTYNASPPSMFAALDVLAERAGRRVAVLADMLELGSVDETAHADVGRRAASSADWLVTVGQRSRIIADAAVRAGMPEQSIAVCRSNDEVISTLRAGIAPGDTVLLKGSHAMRLDEVAAALRADAS